MSSDATPDGADDVAPGSVAGGADEVTPGPVAGRADEVTPGPVAGGSGGVAPGPVAGGSGGVAPGPVDGGAGGVAPGPVAGGADLPETADPAETAGAPNGLPRSVLLGALPLLQHTAGLAVPAIVLTSAVQAVLMYLDVQSGLSPAFLGSFAVSALAALTLYGLLSACALEAVDHGHIRAAEPHLTGAVPGVDESPEALERLAHGRPGPAARRRTRAHAGPFVVWVALQWLVIVLVSVVSPWLIAVVALLTPFLPLAAIDGRRSALLVNVRVIAARFGRWLVTSVVLLLLGLVLFLLSVANTLFVMGTPAAILFWLVIGAVAWWVLTAWALVYRSSAPGHRRG